MSRTIGSKKKKPAVSVPVVPVRTNPAVVPLTPYQPDSDLQKMGDQAIEFLEDYAYGIAPVTPAPVVKSRHRTAKPLTDRKESISSIDPDLDLEAYSIELDKKEPWPKHWPGPWGNGPIPPHPHHEAYLAKGAYQNRLKSERYNTLKARPQNGLV